MIIYAVNVKTGGGKVLLDRLLMQNPFGHTTAAFLDKRYQTPRGYEGKNLKFSPCGRLYAEKELHTLIDSLPQKANESILFFGNLPPFFKPKMKSYLYLQNCYLTRQVPLPLDSALEWFRNWVESWLLKLFYRNVKEIWVQTEWMKQMTQIHLPKASIKIKPFLPFLPEPHPETIKKFKYTYVGSLSRNKGLSEFIKALKELDEKLSEKINVCIILNNKISETSQTKCQFDSLKNINVKMTCQIGREDLFDIYQKTEYLVVTSLYESYYLPVYEAMHFGCKIIAPRETGYLSHFLKEKDFNFYNNQQLNLINYM